MNWVLLGKYCSMTGETRNAVHCRRRDGYWKDGVHCKMVNGRLWINLDAVRQWIESAQPANT